MPATTNAPSRKTSDPASPKPRLPRGGEVGKDAMTALRRFHFDLPVDGDGPRLPSGLLPALLHSYRDQPVRGDYPVFVPPLDGGAEALPLSFGELLDRAMPGGDAARVLRDNLRRLERHARRLLEDGGPADARELLSRAGDELRSDLGLPTDDDARLGESLGKLVSGVPAGGTLIPWGRGDVALHLVRHAARARLQPARTAFLEEARQLAGGLAAMLEAGQDRETSGGAGALGSRFVDPKRLAGLTGASRDASRIEPRRRERLEEAREALDRFIAGGTAPRLSLVLPEDGDAVSLAAPDGDDAWETTTSADPFAAAAERFDAAAAELAGVLRALRVARLERSGDYSPERHGPVLERLDWHAFSDSEMALLPPVVAVASAGHAAGDGLASLSRLLLSGRPVQVLVETDPASSPGEGGEAPLGYRFEPASLGVGLREAFVQQTSLARPVHLAAGLARALSSGRASLHVLDTPPVAAAGEASASLDPWLVAGAALEGRAHPLFLYDPEAGEGWARRLDFSRNPEPARDWPRGDLEVTKEGGGEASLDLVFTFADYALLSPAHRSSLRPVPAGLDHEDLVPLADWLPLEREEAGHKVPWIWGVDGQGILHRLAVDRRLARACRDRLDYWRTLQEMAGVRSEYADRAAETAREKAEDAAREEVARMAEDHAREVERIRNAAAAEVVDRLTAALLEVDVSGLPRPAGAGAAAFHLGGDVDEVTANLLAAVGSLEDRDGDESPPSSPRVEELTSRLMSMLDGADVSQ